MLNKHSRRKRVRRRPAMHETLDFRLPAIALTAACLPPSNLPYRRWRDAMACRNAGRHLDLAGAVAAAAHQ